MSCAHVIAESDQEVHQGDPIYQPDSNRRVWRPFRWQEATDIAAFAVDDGFATDASIAEISAKPSGIQMIDQYGEVGRLAEGLHRTI